MNQIIDFKKKTINWSYNDKRNTIGKFFYNEASSEYLVIVDISTSNQLSNPDVKVGRADGTIKRTKWRFVSAQTVPFGKTGRSKDVILTEEEAKPYNKYIQDLRNFLNDEPSVPTQEPQLETSQPIPPSQNKDDGADKLVGSLFDIIKQKCKYVALINGKLVARNWKKDIWKALDAESKTAQDPITFKWVIGG